MIEFVDFHVVVRKIAEDDPGKYVVVVADAPFARWDVPFHWLGLGRDLKQVLIDAGCEVEQAPQSLYREAGHPALNVRQYAYSISQDRSGMLGDTLFDLLFPHGQVSNFPHGSPRDLLIGSW